MLKDRKEEYLEKLNKYNKKLAESKERWHYIYLDNMKSYYKISTHGRILNTETGKIIEAHHFNDDNEIIDYYLRPTIIFNGKKYRFQMHRMVAFYFCKIPKRLEKFGFTYDNLVVNHKNGIKTCNASFNLEWVTEKENMQHAFNTRLCIGIFGENSHLSNITEKQVIEICELIMDKKNNKEISELTGVTEKTIQHIRSKEDWKTITEKYDFPKLGVAIPYSIPDEKIHEVCKLLVLHKYSDPQIAEIVGVTRENVKDIRLGRRRTDISSQYDFDPSPFNPISDEMIKSVCKLLEEGKLSQRKIAKEVGISQCLISEIFNHKKFTEISSKYKF